MTPSVTLLQDTHSHLKREWHPTLNGKLQFEDLQAHSGTKVWWRCRKNGKHIWEAEVRRRAIMGNGCPYCAGLKVLKEDSFAALFPKLVEEWHPSRNAHLNPWQMAPKSNRRVWWRCNTRHEHDWHTQLHSRTIYGSGCKQCGHIRQPLSKFAPELAREWHLTRNKPLLPDGVSVGSKRRVWWQCRTNPKHEWEASVAVRFRAKTRCPYCAKRSVRTSLPTLDIYSPELVAEWHPIRNQGISPSTVRPNSNRKAWWVCATNPAHEWQAVIRNRAMLGNGCPYCARASKFISPGSSLADRFPEIARQWHPTLNQALKPTDVRPGSSARVWWQCEVNPEHVWDATITVRTHPRSKGRCPFCSGSRVTPETSLANCYPTIAAQWDSERNLPLTPASIKRASARNVWWICPVHSTHRWRALVKNRTLHNTGCPICDSEEKIRRLQSLLLESARSNVDYAKTFEQNIGALRSLIKRPIPKYRNLRQTFYRMLYSSAITALETYLCDAFQQNVIHDNSCIKRLLESVPELKDRKIPFSELLDSDPRERVGEYLSDIVWHNLAKIRLLYRSVLDIEFPTDSAPVYRAIAVRHDLVHRNGRTKSGLRHRFTGAQIEDVFGAIESFVAEVDKQLKRGQPRVAL
jgi:hypothetical protein